MCNPPLPKCYVGECEVSPGVAQLKEELITLLVENDMDQIGYKQWVAIDRSILETFVHQLRSLLTPDVKS